MVMDEIKAIKILVVVPEEDLKDNNKSILKRKHKIQENLTKNLLDLQLIIKKTDLSNHY